ncbi:MAG: ribokinase [Lachnospiraceae bacterium]|nr:ribokinase [Lachnospiraceae bacterium]
MKLLVFGSCNLDFTYAVDHIVASGETESVSEVNVFPGGKGLNQAIALKKAGADCFFAGCIGEDGEMLKEVLAGEGVDTQYLSVVKTRTGHAIIQVDREGRNSILVAPGANHAVTEPFADRVLENFGDGDFLLLQNEISSLPHIIRRAKERGMKVIINPSPYTGFFRTIDLNDVFAVILNETEASMWAGSDRPSDFLALVSDRYPGLKAVLTLGGEGSVFLRGGTVYRQPAYRVKAVDTTAAGDTFTGYFIAGLFRNDPIETVLKYASAAAAIAVSRKGASVSVPTRDEVERLLPEMTLSSGECPECSVEQYIVSTDLS